MSEPDHDPLIGTLIADRYRIDKRLGQGGMGAVYLAEHVRMHKPFAVKVLHKEMGLLSEAVFRFEREAVAAGRVDHEHLVTATDFGELPDGSMYLVLEYVPGENLGTILAEGGRLPAVRALKIARQIAMALAAIHSAGIVHRDVKPDNVMVAARPGTEDFVKLLDFGMAKVQIDAPPEEHQVTRQGIVFGTPRYMAPEQAGGEPTDHRADLYALGIILYAMLAGAPPFSADEIRDVLRMQRFDPPPPLPADVDPGVAALVMTLLAKDPKERVQTADAVIQYIDRIIERFQAPPSPGQRERLLAFVRSRNGIAIVAAALLGIFFVALLAARGLRKSPPPAPSALSVVTAPSAPPGNAALDAVLVRAEVGDTAAWRELEAHPDASRSAREWFVLGVARVSHGDVAHGLDAYLHASELDPKYGSHPRILRDLTSAVQRDTWAAALSVAAALPSSQGADILFDVWAATPKATQATQRARELLATDTVRARASPAVRVAFDLRSVQGQSCEARAPIVARAVTDADSRSFRPLMMLASRTGCGPRNKHDCFPCLRDGDALDRAIARAHDTIAPDYTRIQAAK